MEVQQQKNGGGTNPKQIGLGVKIEALQETSLPATLFLQDVT